MSDRSGALVLRQAAAAATAIGFLLAAPPGSAQTPDAEAPDSADLLERARESQREYELYRRGRIPVVRDTTRARCDERIGRFCIWFGGEGETRFPPEPPETEQARRGLIGVLLEVDEGIDHPWVTGQLVHYLVEQGDPRFAERKARECEIPQKWWCSALLGYSMHVRGAFVEAEAAFREALAAMPGDERRWWTTPRFILSRDAVEEFEELGEAERDRQWELLWSLSDPLFLVEGNDRLTDHFARLVQARNFEDAEHPQGLPWDEDIEETLVRYGRTIGFSRVHDPEYISSPGRMRLRDTRRVLGHHHPKSRGYLFPEDFLSSPSEVPPESWITAPREARTWYAPPYAPDFRALETQVGRFRRGDEMLVVGAYRPTTSVAGAGRAEPTEAVNPFAELPESVETALFLVPVDGGDVVQVPGEGAEGVVTLRARPGRYVSSLEVFDRRGGRAWRARQGVHQAPLTPGLVGVSDLLILREGAPFPTSLDEAIPHVRPGVRVEGDERFTVIWEVYGLRVQEPVQVTVGFTRGRPGFLERVGEFLGILEPESPVVVSFREEAPEEVQSVFRAMVLELPDVEPGEYTLHLRLELTGRQPVVTSRPIYVEG